MIYFNHKYFNDQILESESQRTKQVTFRELGRKL